MSGKNVATARLCHPYDFGNYVATARLRAVLLRSLDRLLLSYFYSNFITIIII